MMDQNMKLNFTKAIAAMLVASTQMIAALIVPAAAYAEAAAPSPITLTSDVKIERVETDAAGKEKITLYSPEKVAVVPGDKVVFMLEVTNNGTQPAAGFRAINPMPGAVQFTSVAEDWADVSVDGGTNWGKLPALKVKAKDGVGITGSERPASPEDVTHVRWVFADTIAPGAKRMISYRGVVK
jgi:uncharacterized repeat protein (TIGR01451 family)